MGNIIIYSQGKSRSIANSTTSDGVISFLYVFGPRIDRSTKSEMEST